MPLYRVGEAIRSFTTVGESSAPTPLQLLIGTYFGDAQQRRAMDEASVGPTTVDAQALASLNDRQQHAVRRSLVQRVLPIQGPPGTGKTQVAEAIFRLWKSTGAHGPAVGVAPSNVAADNLAKRLLKTSSLDVKCDAP